MNELNTDNALEIARRSILAPSGLDDGDLNRLLSGILGHEVDSADLYFQASHQESWSLEDGIVKDGSHSIEQGVGVRAVAGERTGFAYSDDIVLPALTQASEAARAIARRGRSGAVQAWAAVVAMVKAVASDRSLRARSSALAGVASANANATAARRRTMNEDMGSSSFWGWRVVGEFNTLPAASTKWTASRYASETSA